MKLELRNLRRLIREMALASISSVVSRDDEGGEETAERRRHRKFHSTPLYRSKAESVFKLFGVPVHIVPVYRKSFPGSARGTYVSIEEVAPILQKAGLDVEALEGELEAGACVILATSRKITDQFWPTPWMLLHALLDDPFPSRESRAMHKKTVGLVYDKIADLSGSGPYKYDDFMRALVGSMTMKSARDGYFSIDQLTDIATELTIQAAVSSRGCRIEEFPGDEEINSVLRDLEGFINGLDVRGALEDYMRGRIIRVEGETSQFK